MENKKQVTAVEWLFLMLNNPNSDQDFANKLLNKAKEMEKQQLQSYAEFAIRCDRMDMKILNFEDFVKLETFNK
jgi:hypothetical protein